MHLEALQTDIRNVLKEIRKMNFKWHKIGYCEIHTFNRRFKSLLLQYREKDKFSGYSFSMEGRQNTVQNSAAAL
jgi:isocitrate lyase